MKRNSIIFFFLICIAVASYGQNGDLKRYKDYIYDFEGYGAAKFLGSVDLNNYKNSSLFNIGINELSNLIEEKFFIENFSLNLSPLEKITKNDKWVLNKALEEWDYSDGDCFVAICSNRSYFQEGQEGVIGIVFIENKGNKIWRYYQGKAIEKRANPSSVTNEELDVIEDTEILGNDLNKKIDNSASSTRADKFYEKLGERLEEKIYDALLNIIPQDIRDEFELNSFEDLANLLEEDINS